MYAYNKLVVGIFTIAVLVSVGMLIIKKPSTFTKQEIVKEEEVVQNEPVIKEEFKDGVYTNYTYGFRFEYDEEIFSKTYPWNKNSGTNKRFFVEGQRFPQLAISLLNKDIYGNLYENCNSAKDHSLISTSERSSSASYKEYDLINICVSRVVPYPGKVEAGWGYGAIMPVENIEGVHYLLINVSVSDENELNSWEDKFDSIVKSFKIMDK